jgi:LmbE family N-acetylglucosaminyl deacetylase
LLALQTIVAPLYNAYYTVEGATREIKVESDRTLYLSEALLLSDGTLPDGLFNWQSPTQKADILVVAAHPDDELLYFGGTLPTYAGQRGLNVQVVYLACDERARIDEALDGLWVCGVRNAPVFLGFRDAYSETLEEAQTDLDRDAITAAIVETIRRFKPEVIVTHDLSGEYGHGVHMLTARCTLDAVAAAADGEQFTDSANLFGVWQAQKLYLHLYNFGKITMDWRVPLSAFDGKTALEVANIAYARHLSQQSFQHAVYDDGKYSSAEFGLVYSAVGSDEAGNDFLEHIDPSRLSDYTVPETEQSTQPEPTDAQATPEVTATPTQCPADRLETPIPGVLSNAVAINRWLLLGIVSALMVICVALLLRIRGDSTTKTMKNRDIK